MKVDPALENGVGLVAVLTAPVYRLMEASVASRFLAGALAFFQLIFEDMFLGILALLVVATLIDWWYGRKVAKRADVYDPVKARLGLDSKMAGVLIALLVWSFEWWVGMHTPFASHGIFAVALTVALFIEELESLRRHRQKLGGENLAILDRVMEWIHSIPEKLIGGRNEP